jgi:xanthine dehydrogenase accessory factor
MSLDNLDWIANDLIPDMRPVMFRMARGGTPFGLATILADDTGQPPAGAQMVVTLTDRHGILFGGDFDDEIARRARAAIVDGKPHRPTGSPAGTVLIERVDPDDPALRELEELTLLRQPVLWSSDGETRSCSATDRYTVLPAGDDMARVIFKPYQRLVVVGTSAFAMTIVRLGLKLNWEVELVGAREEHFAASLPGLSTINSSPDRFLQAAPPDRWTAIVVASGDADSEIAALVPALLSHAGYVAATGSHALAAERNERLLAAGVPAAAIRRLKTPTAPGSETRDPWDVAQTVTTDIAALDRNETAPLGGANRNGRSAGPVARVATAASRGA